jgi:uncharacterized membrane protein YczE
MTHPSSSKTGQYIWRFLLYLLALLVLALGITMNTKAGLGVSPLISVSYSASEIWGFNFGNATLVLYSSYIVIEVVLHTIQARQGRLTTPLPTRLLLDVLQFPLSLVFTRFLNLFSAWIPDLAEAYAGQFWGSLPGRVLFLLIAIVFTGVGAALSLDMRLIPNPGDGIVQAISDTCGKSVGLCKNLMDLTSVVLTLVLCFAFAHRLLGVGLGTILCVIGVGRVVALFNRLCYEKAAALSGLPSRKNPPQTAPQG